MRLLCSFCPLFECSGALQKDFTPFFEPFSAVFAKLGNAAERLLHGLFGGETRLGEKLVGKAHYLLLYAHRHQLFGKSIGHTR